MTDLANCVELFAYFSCLELIAVFEELKFNMSFSRSRSRDSVRSKIKLFAIIVNGFCLNSPLDFLLVCVSDISC